MNWGNKEASLEALYLLDSALLEPDEEYLRLISKTKNENSLRYKVDNGQGDLLDVIFTQDAVLIRGFDHENELNQFSASIWDQSVIDKIYKGVEPKFSSLFSSKERDQTTFFIWLLAYTFDSFDKFSEFVKGYYEINFDDDMLKKLYEVGELSQEDIKILKNKLTN